MQLTLLIHTGGEEWDSQEVLAALLHSSAVSPTLYQVVFAQQMTLTGHGDDFFDPRAWIDWLHELGDPDTTLIRADGLAPVALSLPVRLRFTCADAFFVGEYHTPYSEIALWADEAQGSP